MHYNKKELESAVSNSTSMNEVARNLGLGPLNSRKRKNLRNIILSKGISINHFTHSGKYTKEKLIGACAISFTYSEVARRLGAPEAQASVYSYIKRLIKKHQISTKHFLHRGWSKGRIFPNRRKLAKEILIYHQKKFSRVPSYQLVRALREIGREYKCEFCGSGETLEVDHLDGNWRNCVKENLRFLCLPCHAKTPTYGSRNRIHKSKNTNNKKETIFLDALPKTLKNHYDEKELYVLTQLVAPNTLSRDIIFKLIKDKYLQDWLTKNV